MDYTSPEMQKLPEFAQLMPGVAAMSLDPVGIAYNTSLMTKAPTSVADLGQGDCRRSRQVQGQDHHPRREWRLGFLGL